MKARLATAVAVCWIGASTAHAGSYVSLGIGSEAQLGGDLGDQYSTTKDSSVGRLAIGERLGPLALEVSVFGAGMNTAAGQEMTAASVGVDLKYHLGLIGGLEGYIRGGLSRTWVMDREESMMDTTFSGKGKSFGGGLQYLISLPVGQFGLWADYNRQSVTLAGDTGSLDGTAKMYTVGVTVGL